MAAANLVSVERACVTVGTRALLDDVSLGVAEGDRIGVVGRNGGGKSTLLRVLAAEQELDAGRVAHTGSLRVGLLHQDDDLGGGADVAAVVVPGLAAHEWAADPRMREIVGELLGGLDAGGVGGWDAAVTRLSGGERRRVALAALLVADPELVLLDEPTNHLDVEGVAWLAAYLVRRRTRAGTALVVVTHDRWFLDEVATSTWEVHDGAVASFAGGYAAYVLAKAERDRMAAVTAERRDNLIRKELAWLRRGPPARTSKPKFRIDAAATLIEDEPAPRDQVALVRFATTRLGKDVIDLLDATVRVGERTLLDRVTWRLAPGDRVGIVGVNGAGKTTLLKVLFGEVPLASGRRKVGTTVVAGYLTQDVEELDKLAGRRVIDAITDVREVIRLGDKEVSASQLAQRLGFSGARQQTPVSGLSGGERRRLQVLRLLMSEPNVLLLDEPTNDLDIETLTSLEDVLDGWAGTLLVVSHDRYLLERMCDRQVALYGDGKVVDLPGGVEQYLRELPARAVTRPAAGALPVTLSAGAAPARRGTVGTPDPAVLREARKELARVEKTLTRIATATERLHAEMVDAATDHAALAGLTERLRALDAEREQLEEAWLAAAEVVG